MKAAFNWLSVADFKSEGFPRLGPGNAIDVGAGVGAGFGLDVEAAPFLSKSPSSLMRPATLAKVLGSSEGAGNGADDGAALLSVLGVLGWTSESSDFARRRGGWGVDDCEERSSNSLLSAATDVSAGVTLYDVDLVVVARNGRDRGARAPSVSESESEDEWFALPAPVTPFPINHSLLFNVSESPANQGRPESKPQLFGFALL